MTQVTAPPKSARLDSEHLKWVERYRRSTGLSTFTEALKQIIRRMAEDQGWVR